MEISQVLPIIQLTDTLNIEKNTIEFQPLVLTVNKLEKGLKAKLVIKPLAECKLTILGLKWLFNNIQRE